MVWQLISGHPTQPLATECDQRDVGNYDTIRKCLIKRTRILVRSNTARLKDPKQDEKNNITATITTTDIFTIIIIIIIIVFIIMIIVRSMLVVLRKREAGRGEGWSLHGSYHHRHHHYHHHYDYFHHVWTRSCWWSWEREKQARARVGICMVARALRRRDWTTIITTIIIIINIVIKIVIIIITTIIIIIINIVIKIVRNIIIATTTINLSTFLIISPLLRHDHLEWWRQQLDRHRQHCHLNHHRLTHSWIFIGIFALIYWVYASKNSTSRSSSS